MDGVAVRSIATISTDNIIRRGHVHTDNIRVVLCLRSGRCTGFHETRSKILNESLLDGRQDGRFDNVFAGSFGYREIVFECNKYSDATVYAKEPISRGDCATWNGCRNHG